MVTINKRKLLYIRPMKSADIFVEELTSAGWDVHVVTEAEQALQLMEKFSYHVGIILLDTDSDKYLDACEKRMLSTNSNLEWVALLSPLYVNCERIRTLIVDYFYDYHTLPPDKERLLCILGHAYGMAEAHLKYCRQRESPHPGEHEIIGISPAIKNLLWEIDRLANVADADTLVLIAGESGTGKELAARTIHKRSKYAQGPFVAVNCGALPTNLIQSELFGHERGSFTGAYQRKIGLIEVAHGGTIFLDEIGDLPLDLQVNLLRFLQEKTIVRIGSTQKIHIDVLVVAATHVDLEKAVQQGRFREDLYYRLNVLCLTVPPLRERQEDIELLARQFFHKFLTRNGRSVKGFTPEALQVMAYHDWPGNVRELINCIRRAMVMCEGRFITPADLGLERRSSKRSIRIRTLSTVREEAEREAILSTLRYTQMNISSAAQILGVSRATLYRLMEKHRIVGLETV